MDEDEVTNLGVALWSDPLLATIEERHVFLDVTFPEEVDEILDLPPTPEILILLDEDSRWQALDRIEHQKVVGRDRLEIVRHSGRLLTMNLTSAMIVESASSLTVCCSRIWRRCFRQSRIQDSNTPPT